MVSILPLIPAHIIGVVPCEEKFYLVYITASRGKIIEVVFLCNLSDIISVVSIGEGTMINCPS
jgi:hypothetical protein